MNTSFQQLSMLVGGVIALVVMGVSIAYFETSTKAADQPSTYQNFSYKAADDLAKTGSIIDKIVSLHGVTQSAPASVTVAPEDLGKSDNFSKID
jgi:hypothetical protein